MQLRMVGLSGKQISLAESSLGQGSKVISSQKF